MGRKQSGIYQDGSNRWCVDKVYGGTRLRERFDKFEEAENWLICQLEILRQVHLFGARRERTFNEAAAKYLMEHQAKISLQTDIYMLQSVMPFVGHLTLDKIHDATLSPYVSKRLAAGRSHKTINLALAIVRRILNLSARSWRDEESGKTWLETPPLIKLLPLVGFQREPRPIAWYEQKKLFEVLPKHLLNMALFDLNTGARDEVVCGLKWDWEIEIPELETSVFLVPKDSVKGRKSDRILVCNQVAKQVIDTQRGLHEEYVFTYKGHRIETMNNSAWQRARRIAGLGDLHVHDLRHTVGMRLREAEVREETIADVLWHNRPSMTAHYSMAQVCELFEALNKITNESNRVNRSLVMIAREARNLKVPANSPDNKKGLEAICI
ncbi:MAG: tyrosine-type recombinase/integrase [Pseudomonadota bacterium]